MAESRLSSFLKMEFAKNPELKRKCLHAFHKKLQQNDVSRSFDSFPDFINRTEVLHLLPTISKLINHMNKYHTGDCVSNHVKIEIRRILGDLSEIACDQLYDQFGHVKPELAEVLELNPDQHSFEPSKLITAYLNPFIPLVYYELNLSEKENYHFGIINSEFNTQIKSCVPEEVYNQKYHPGIFKQAEKQLSDHPEAAIVGVAVIASLLLFGGKAMKNMHDKNNANQPKRY